MPGCAERERMEVPEVCMTSPKKILLTAAFSLLLSISAIAQTSAGESNKNDSLALIKREANPTATQATLSASGATQSQTEPLLLLLFGLAVFVGATTVKHKRANADRETRA